MKTMTCKQLGGACDHKLSAKTFAEMAALSRKHSMEMLSRGDRAHREAMNEMQKTMGSPDSMARWMEDRRMEFEKLPEDK
jgi:hypothetical protein